MKCIEYYPKVIAEIKEMQVISGVFDKELLNLRGVIDYIYREMFIQTAEEAGLLHWEQILNITVTDYDDIELRRFNILAKLMSFKPNLVESLNALIGPGSYKLKYFSDEFRLKVTLILKKAEYTGAIRQLLDVIVPLNIALSIYLAKNTHNDLSQRTHNDLHQFTFNELMGVVEYGI